MQTQRATSLLALSSIALVGLLWLGPRGPSAAWAQPKPGADKPAPDNAQPAGDAKAKPVPGKKADKKDPPAPDAKGDAKPDDKAGPTPEGKPGEGAPGKEGEAKEESEPPAAAPPTPEQIEEAKKAFLEGKRLFDDEKDYKGAVEQFKKSYRLSRNPLLLYNVGFTLDQMNEKSMAIFYYEKFLKDTQPGAVNRDLAKERLKALGREIEADSVFEGGGATDTGTTDTGKTTTAEPPKPATPEVTTFQHNVIEEAPPGKPLDVTAFVPENAKWQVMLFYRGQGARKFASVPMRPRYNELVGRIPATAMAGTSVQYYIEARDQSGTLVDRSGRSTSPNLVFVNPKAKPSYYPDLTGERSWEGAGTAQITPGGGSTSLGGGGQPTGTGGWTDVQSTKFKYLKWGTTASAVGFLAMSISFYVIASNASSGLEGEAVNSTEIDECAALGGPPCRSFADRQKSFEARGEYYETATNLTMGLGLISAGVAGYFWYKEISAKKGTGGATASTQQSSPAATTITATPVVGKDFVGGAATLRF